MQIIRCDSCGDEKPDGAKGWVHLYRQPKPPPPTGYSEAATEDQEPNQWDLCPRCGPDSWGHRLDLLLRLAELFARETAVVDGRCVLRFHEKQIAIRHLVEQYAEAQALNNFWKQARAESHTPV